MSENYGIAAANITQNLDLSNSPSRIGLKTMEVDVETTHTGKNPSKNFFILFQYHYYYNSILRCWLGSLGMVIGHKRGLNLISYGVIRCNTVIKCLSFVERMSKVCEAKKVLNLNYHIATNFPPSLKTVVSQNFKFS